MALQQIRIGSSDNVLQYDDADFDSAIETDQPISAGTPVDPSNVLRLDDIGTLVMESLSGTATGDIIRWNHTTLHWEVDNEPFEYNGIILNPMLEAAATAIEGFLFYDSASNALKVYTDP